jgi:hypothetical protein
MWRVRAAMMAKASSRQGGQLQCTPSTSGITSLPGMCPPLRMHLVLDIDAGKPCFLEHLDRVVHVHGIAVAGVGIGGQRDGECAPASGNGRRFPKSMLISVDAKGQLEMPAPVVAAISKPAFSTRRAL